MAGLSAKNWHEHILNQIKLGSLNPSLNWLKKLQQEQMDVFVTQGLPTRKIEDWHYTDISDLENHTLKFSEKINSQKINSGFDIEKLKTENYVCVFMDGFFSYDLSSIQDLPEGVILTNIRDILKKQPDVIKPYLIKFSQEFIGQSFVCLNTAVLSDGLFLYVPDHVQIKQPIHVLCLNSAEDYHEHNTAHLRHIIIGGENSCMTVFEEYQGKGDFYFNTIVTQIHAQKKSIINHYKLQNEGDGAYHIGHITVKQEQNSCVYLNNFSLGGLLAREDLDVNLEREGAHCQLNGLYLLKNQRHMDQHIRVHHRSGHSSSEQLYRGIVDGDARGVFNGRVVVHPEAQKSKAKQSNQNILLSKSAAVNTKPEFEIYADDVQCAHGATVGNIDENAIFYLRSRGLNKQESLGLLVNAFSEIILKQITLSVVQEKIAKIVHQKTSGIFS